VVSPISYEKRNGAKTEVPHLIVPLSNCSEWRNVDNVLQPGPQMTFSQPESSLIKAGVTKDLMSFDSARPRMQSVIDISISISIILLCRSG
jgi:hypothetical protein